MNIDSLWAVAALSATLLLGSLLGLVMGLLGGYIWLSPRRTRVWNQEQPLPPQNTSDPVERPRASDHDVAVLQQSLERRLLDLEIRMRDVEKGLTTLEKTPTKLERELLNLEKGHAELKKGLLAVLKTNQQPTPDQTCSAVVTLPITTATLPVSGEANTLSPGGGGVKAGVERLHNERPVTGSVPKSTSSPRPSDPIPDKPPVVVRPKVELPASRQQPYGIKEQYQEDPLPPSSQPELDCSDEPEFVMLKEMLFFYSTILKSGKQREMEQFCQQYGVCSVERSDSAPHAGIILERTEQPINQANLWAVPYGQSNCYYILPGTRFRVNLSGFMADNGRLAYETFQGIMNIEHDQILEVVNPGVAKLCTAPDQTLVVTKPGEIHLPLGNLPPNLSKIPT